MCSMWLLFVLFSRHSARFDRDEMVFGDLNGGGGGGGLDNRDNNQRDEAARIQALRTANCIKILGKGVIRVVHRVDDARESNALGMPSTYAIWQEMIVLIKCLIL